ncbi:MAG TPA: hypothetical protein VKB23_12850 [Solirubrobacterales bacterium]|nr:hypothetical protein [Solirubrobacterales bacterium]
MTHFKTLSSAALTVALAAACFAALAPTASGTVLCKAKEAPCSAINRYAKETKFKAESGVMTLTRTWESLTTTIECQNSRIWGSTLTAGGGIGVPVEAKTEAVEFRECHVIGLEKGCEDVWLTAPNSPKTTFANTLGTMNGTLTMSGSGTTEPTIKVRCEGESTGCIYKAPSLVFDVTGGEEATLVAKEEKLKGPGFGCPQNLDWDGTYKFVEPKPLYIPSS